VGWLKNFIHNRSLAEENMMRGYCVATISRCMPAEVTVKVNLRALRRTSEGRKGKGPFESFVRMESDKGTGAVVISENPRNKKRKAIADYPHLRGAIALLRAKGLLGTDEVPTHIQRMVNGVKVNDIKLAKGVACEFSWTNGRGPGGDLRVGVIVCLCLVELGSDTEEEGLFMLVKEHEVVERHDGVTVINKLPLTQQVCIPVQCMTFCMKLLPPPGDRPVQFPLEEEEAYEDRLVRPWWMNFRHLWALRVASAV
jgi:hypothetical protein